MTAPPVLDVKNLVLTLSGADPGQSLVSGLSLLIPPRKIMGLIGQSGCGKSLTCLSIMGLLPKNIRRIDGDIHVAGRCLNDMPQSQWRSLRGRKMAMILQNPMSCFDPVFTIRRHFKETLASHTQRNLDYLSDYISEARTAISEVGFDSPDEILDLYPFQMSGGMLQRIMVALALMMNVSLLIADEPTTDLDVVSQAHILDLLEHLRNTHGMSILLVTHDLSVIARLADHVTVMNEGMAVETGTVKKIFTDSRHPYTRSLLQAHFSLYGPRLGRILGMDHNETHDPNAPVR
jgi:nickel transport system ATP-binding protein